MIQRGGGASLLLEPLQSIRVLGERGWKHLDRHVALEPFIAGAVDLSHPARADEISQQIRSQTSARRIPHPAKIIGRDLRRTCRDSRDLRDRRTASNCSTRDSQL